MSSGNGSGSSGRPDTQRIVRFRVGERVFASHGVSIVRVTRREVDKEGRTTNVAGYLEIPIKSSGVSELMDQLAEGAPKPPMRNQLIKPDSELGQEMGLTRAKVVTAPDVGDPRYMEEKRKFDQKTSLAIVAQALDAEIVREDGTTVITDRDEKIEALRSMGVTMWQFNQMAEDARQLTQMSEEDKAAFFAAPLASGGATRD